MKTQLMKERGSIFDDIQPPEFEERRVVSKPPRPSLTDDMPAEDIRPRQVLAAGDTNGSSRCYALEQAYVHDVYAQIARECGACSPVRSHIKEFIFEELEYGSLLMDIGCGDGKYLNINSGVFTLGMERCQDWFSNLNESQTNRTSNQNSAMSRGDFLLGDVLNIPVRDEFFDGALCCGVLHHISTFERRVFALREIGRLLKVGGKILITVWAFEGRELGSQDVLIKWNSTKPNPRRQPKGRHSDTSDSESDDDCTTTSSCSTTTANYVNRRAAYESCNSPTAEFGTCYSFVKRALQKFNLAPATFTHSSRRPSKTNSTNKEVNCPVSSAFDDMPIELRNIDENAPINTQYQNGGSKRSSLVGSVNNKATAADVPATILNDVNVQKRRLSRTDSIKEHYGSFMSLIKEHILPKNNSKAKSSEKSPSKRMGNGLLQHRFSLPVVASFRRPSGLVVADRFTPIMSVTKEASLEKSPSFGDEMDMDKSEPELEDLHTDSAMEETLDQVAELGLIRKVSKDVRDQATLLMISRSKKRDVFVKGLQKSLSSDSLESRHSLSKQQSIKDTESSATTTATSVSTSDSTSGGKLVAYYSMPELRSLDKWTAEDVSPNTHLRMPRNRPKLADLHPITFLDIDKTAKAKEVKRNDSEDTQAAVDEISSSILSLESRTNLELISTSPHGSITRVMKEKLQLDLPMGCHDMDMSMDSPMTHLLTAQEREDAKKSHRSLSVEYKAQISPSNRPPRRRFSASPSLYVPKTFIQMFVRQELEQNQHETHPSVDSEESFVTIIPANRSCRGSCDLMTSKNQTDNDSDGSFVDDVMMDIDDQVLSAGTTSGDDAVCENLAVNLAIAGHFSGDNTSQGSSASGSTLSTKSVSLSSTTKTPTISAASTPSPPANLHRFFHLFRCGELEELIESNVDNLCVVRSYYSEHATSWCVVAEKVQVWTI